VECHSSIHFTSFHTLRTQNQIRGNNCSLLHPTNVAATLIMSLHKRQCKTNRVHMREVLYCLYPPWSSTLSASLLRNTKWCINFVRSLFRARVYRARERILIYYYYYYYYYYTIWICLSQAISSRYFSWTSSDPHRSRFKLHTAVLSVLCVTFQV